jgi:hypothetical protein
MTESEGIVNIRNMGAHLRKSGQDRCLSSGGNGLAVKEVSLFIFKKVKK